ncbi:hypothetical protein AKJ51_00795 [candidate division MSBL1 archaeon SCGC-AAA382A20]|uniref:Uncharacterized protein n=1 Tax=candidate division MSBL1 archaeon SCGC-AAA382A20 TaxID=1698280 RepID=A0A133VMF2_9EURY|nr:hypothetical protein AKJ51_00795 [candidate division MSBL1 archaeon SCGC-AAA382A20]
MKLQTDTYGSRFMGNYNSSSLPYDQPAYNQENAFSDNYQSAYPTYLPSSRSHNPANGLHDRVFGPQVKEQEYTLTHLTDKKSERRSLHLKHIKELERRIGKLQEDISVARMLSGGTQDKDEIKLQGQLQQLEKQKRKEELDYWKDMAEVNRESLETTMGYEASKRRAGLFQGMEL